MMTDFIFYFWVTGTGCVRFSYWSSDVRVRRLQKKEAECLRIQSCRHKQRVDVAQPHHNNGYSAVPPSLHPEEQTSTALECSQNEHLRIQKMLPKWVDVTLRPSPTFVVKAFLNFIEWSPNLAEGRENK